MVRMLFCIDRLRVKRNCIAIASQYQASPWQTLASADAGKDRTISQIDEKCD